MIESQPIASLLLAPIPAPATHVGRGEARGGRARTPVGPLGRLHDTALEVARHSIPIAERSGRGSNRPPIPGTTKRHRLEENLGAAAIQLTANDLWEIDPAASGIEVHGARYRSTWQKLVGR